MICIFVYYTGLVALEGTPIRFVRKSSGTDKEQYDCSSELHWYKLDFSFVNLLEIILLALQ